MLQIQMVCCWIPRNQNENLVAEYPFQPTRLGVGFNYEEIRERCQQVTGQGRAQGQDSGHIVNVDDTKHVRFSPEIKQKDYNKNG